MKSELQRMGVPAEEIAFINDYNTSVKRQRLFNDMNDGKVRILIGHPETLGTGVNVQSRVLGSHNLDPLWYPALDEQRVGRPIRQGNMNREVGIWDYSVESPLDSIMWSMMAKKAGFIHNFWKRDGVRSMEDITMDDYYEQMKAATSGDPRVQELGEIKRAIAQIEQKEISHERSISGLRLSKIAIREDIANAKRHLVRMQRMKEAAENIRADDFKATFEWEGQGKTEVAKRKDAEGMFKAAFKLVDDMRIDSRMGETSRLAIGNIAGFDMVASNPITMGVEDARRVDRVNLTHPSDPDLNFTIEVEQGKNPLPSIEDWLRRIPERTETAEAKLASAEKESADLNKLSSDPTFPQRKEIHEKRRRAREIEVAMAEETKRQRDAEKASERAAAAAQASAPATPARDVAPEPAPERTSEDLLRWRDRVATEVGKITRGWDPDMMPEVRIVRGRDDMPAQLQDSFDRNPDAMRGAYWQDPNDGRAYVFIVPDNMASIDQARRTLLHETVGHFAMQDMLGEEFSGVLAGVWQAREHPQIKQIAEEVAKTYADSSETVQAEEIIARMAEKQVKHPAMVRAIAAVRRFLRGLGFRMSFTYNDIMGMIARAERRLRTNRDTTREAEFRRPEPDQPTDTQELRRKDALDRFKASVNEAVAENIRNRQAADPRFDRGAAATERARPKTRRYIDPKRPVESLFRVLTIPAGGLDADGNLRVTQPMQRVAQKLVQEYRPTNSSYFRWMDKPLEIARHGWLNRYGTPREFIVRERQKFADEFEIMQELVGFLKGLSAEEVGLEEAKALQEVLEGKELNNDRMKRMAGPIRKSIEGYGRELVEMGLLPEEAYLRNLGTYLHRSYRQYEFEAPGLVKWARKKQSKARKAALAGDELMARGRRHRVSQSRILKNIPDKFKKMAASPDVVDWVILDRLNESGRVMKRIYWPAGPVGELIGPAPTGKGTWVNQGTWRLGHEKGKAPRGMVMLRRDYSEAERAEMGEIRDARYNLIKTYELLARDISTGRFFEDISKNPDWFVMDKPDGVVVDAAEVTRFYSTIAGIEWVRIPDTIIPKSSAKRWGALSGGYIRAAIWRDMNELEKMQTHGTWGWLLREWKSNKALALDTPIPTPTGWTTMGEIKVGDTVFDEKGQSCTVEEVKDIQHGRPCYEVEFSDRTKIVADDEHWWFVTGRNNPHGKVLTTAQIRDTLTYSPRGDRNHSVPVTGALNLPDADLPLPPYALGLWLGDGDASRPKITVGAKAIPSVYLRGSADQRLSLLRGLMDSDDWITERGDCGFATSASTLRDGVTELLRSLGYKPMIEEFESASGKTAWRIYFKAYADTPIFGLKGKVERLRLRPDSSQRSSTRQIVGVTQVPSVPVRCIAVSSESHLYLAGEGFVPTHNTARSPTVHFNNTIGNLILSEIYDFTFSDIARGLKEFADRGEFYQEAVREGIFGSGFVRTELNRVDVDGIIDQVIKEVEGVEGVNRGIGLAGRAAGGAAVGAAVASLIPSPGPVAAVTAGAGAAVGAAAGAAVGPNNARQIFELFKKMDRGLRAGYRWEDEIFRLVSYMRDRNRGLEQAEAAQNAIDRFLNYDIRAPWPNALRRSVLPFLSYTYAVVPQLLRAMANKPWKIAKIATLGYVLQELAYEITDGDEDEERRVMAERDLGYTWAGLPKMLRLPFTDQGDPVYVGLTRVLPGGGSFDVDKGQIGLPEWMMVSGPLATAAEVWINRSAYTGQDIVNRMTDTEMEAAEKRILYLWRSMMPNAPWVPGSWNWKMLTGSMMGETDIFGRSYSVPMAAVRQFGPRLYPFDVDSQRAYRMMDISRERNEFRRKAKELSMDRSQNRISRSAYDRGMGRVREGFDRLREKAEGVLGNDE